MKGNNKNVEIRDFLDDDDVKELGLVDFNQIKINSNMMLIVIFQKNTGAINMSSIVLDDGLNFSRRFFDELMGFIDYFLPLKYQDNPLVNNFVLRIVFTGTENFIYDVNFSNSFKDLFVDLVNITNRIGFVINDDNISLFNNKYKNVYKLYVDLKKDINFSEFIR